MGFPLHADQLGRMVSATPPFGLSPKTMLVIFTYADQAVD